MNTETINMGGYNLHLIKTKKFKTISIEVKFYRDIKKEEIIKRNLIKMLLLNSSNNYQTERELIIQSENLYDINIASSIYRRGMFSVLSFGTRFLNEKYTSIGMNKESIIFFLDLIFNPYVKDNAFVNVDKEKNRLKEDILSIKDNKVKYALIKLLESIKDKPYSYSPYGEIEELDLINGKNLYEYYKSIIKEDKIDVFVVGDIDTNEIKTIFHEYFKINTFKKEKKNILVEEIPVVKKINRIIKYDNVKQSQLLVLCSLNGLSSFERKYVIRLYNEILGGSTNSLLFENVREKNGFCYYINSSAMPYDNILVINSGTSKENIEDAIKLIKKCIKDVTNGKIDDEIIESAKKIIISSIKIATDDPSSIIADSFSKVLVDSDLDCEKIKKYESITKEDIIKVSKKVNINTILTLENKEELNGED